MSKQIMITEEEYNEYKNLRHFWCQTSDKFMALKEHIIEMMIVANSEDMPGVTQDDLLYILLSLANETNECAVDYESFLNNYIEELIG